MCAAYFPKKDDPKSSYKGPNLMDYMWESGIDPETNEEITALQAYKRDTQEMFHYFYEAIAKPKSVYWRHRKDNWDEIMKERPWIAKEGFLYRGTHDEYTDPKDGVAMVSKK